MAQFTTTCQIDLFCANCSWLGLRPHHHLPPPLPPFLNLYLLILTKWVSVLLLAFPLVILLLSIPFLLVYYLVISVSVHTILLFFYHSNVRSFTILLHSFTPHFSYRSSFLILLDHLIFMIFLKVFFLKDIYCIF